MPSFEGRDAFQALWRRAIEDDTALPQKYGGILFAFIMLRAMPTTV